MANSLDQGARTCTLLNACCVSGFQCHYSICQFVDGFWTPHAQLQLCAGCLQFCKHVNTRVRLQCNLFCLLLTCTVCCYKDTDMLQRGINACLFRKDAHAAWIWSTSLQFSFCVFVCVCCNGFKPMHDNKNIRNLQPGILSQESSTCRNCRLGYNEILVLIVYIAPSKLSVNINCACWECPELRVDRWGGVAVRASGRPVGRGRFPSKNAKRVYLSISMLLCIV